MTLAEVAPQTPQPLQPVGTLFDMPHRLSSNSSLRHRVQRLSSMSSSHSFQYERVKGFHEATDITVALSKLHTVRRGTKPLSARQKRQFAEDITFQTASDLAEKVMSIDPGDTTFAIAFWEQLATIARLELPLFDDVQPVATRLSRDISRYFEDPIQFGLTTEAEQKNATRRFKIIQKVKPRDTFQL